MGNSVIRSVAPGGAVGTLAGNTGISALLDGAGVDACLSHPLALALSGNAATLYIADTGNAAIRALDLTTHYVTTLALAAGDDPVPTSPGDPDPVLNRVADSGGGVPSPWFLLTAAIIVLKRFLEK
jgi:hypothetical protein